MITYSYNNITVKAYPSVNEIPELIKHKIGDELPERFKGRDLDSIPFFIKYSESDEQNLSNIIYQINFSLKGVSEELNSEGVPIEAFVDSRCNLRSVNPSNFKSTDDLNTEEISVWIESVLSEHGIAALKKRVEEKINAATSPKSVDIVISE